MMAAFSSDGGSTSTADTGTARALFRDVVGGCVRRALVSFYGVEVGTSAWLHAMSVADLRWDEVRRMANPSGFLFRLGRSEARRSVRWAGTSGTFPSTDRLHAAYDGAMVQLFDALTYLKPMQRAALMLVKGYGYSLRETAAVLELDEAAVYEHVRRGWQRLRGRMEVE